MRNRFVVWVANQVLALATDRYRTFLRGSTAYGLYAAARDQECDCETVA